MQVSSGIGTSSKKEYEVIRNSGVNAIISNVIQFKTNHQLVNGEKGRVFSNTGETPSGIINDKVYFAIAGGTLAADRIQLASTFNDAATRRPITGISNGGGKLTVVSTVSDKTPSDPAHPMQYDETTYTIGGVSNTVGGWYILGHPSTTFNGIFLLLTPLVWVLLEKKQELHLLNVELTTEVYLIEFTEQDMLYQKNISMLVLRNLVLFYKNLRQLV